MKLLNSLILSTFICGSVLADSFKLSGHEENFVRSLIEKACHSHGLENIYALSKKRVVKSQLERTLVQFDLPNGLEGFLAYDTPMNADEGRLTLSAENWPAGCDAPSEPETIECGDHWLSVTVTSEAKSNSGSLSFSGDSNPEWSDASFGFYYPSKNVRRAQTRDGYLTLTTDIDTEEVSATFETNNGDLFSFPNCQ